MGVPYPESDGARLPVEFEAVGHKMQHSQEQASGHFSPFERANAPRAVAGPRPDATLPQSHAPDDPRPSEVPCRPGFETRGTGTALGISTSLAIVLSAVLGLGVVLVLLGLLGHYGIRKGVQHDRFLLAVGRLRSRRGPRHQELNKQKP